MATLSITIPKPIKDWVDTRTRTGDYANTDAYILELIRRDRERADKIAAMQRYVDEGLASGVGDHSKESLFEAAIAHSSQG